MDKVGEKLEKGIIISIIISVAVYFIMFALSDTAKIKEAVSSIGLLTFGLLLLLTLGNTLFRFARWHMLLKNAKIRISLKDSFKSFFSSLALTMTPGKSGELFKASFVKKFANVSRLKVIPIAVLERVFDLTGFALILLICISFSSLGEYSEKSLLISASVLAGVVLMFFILKIKKVRSAIMRCASKIKMLKKREEVIKDVLDDYSKLSLADITIYFVISAIGWSFEVLELYIILRSIGIGISVFNAGFIFGFSSLAGLIVFTPGGIGGFEGTSYSLMTFLFGMSSSMATTATFIIRLTTIWFVVLMGIVSYLKFAR